MSLAIIFSRARYGLAAPLVTVEVHLSNGLPAFQLVGWGDKTPADAMKVAIAEAYGRA